MLVSILCSALMWSCTGRHCFKARSRKYCCALADAGPSKLLNPLAHGGGAAEAAPVSHAFAFYRRGAPLLLCFASWCHASAVLV